MQSGIFRVTEKFFPRINPLRLYLPLTCPVCGGLPFDGTPGMFCADCLARIEFVHEPLCPGCGGELSGILKFCSSCLNSEAERPWEKAFSIYKMNGFGKELIHMFKYQNHPEFARSLAYLAVQRLGDKLRAENLNAVAPVPLHWIRYLQRGFNQSELFARGIGKALGIPVNTDLKRVKWTRQQASLSRKQRILNLKQAFRVKNSTNVKNGAILLVDDVLTTGSTLAAAADALLNAGAAKICVLVIARR